MRSKMEWKRGRSIRVKEFKSVRVSETAKITQRRRVCRGAQRKRKPEKRKARGTVTQSSQR